MYQELKVLIKVPKAIIDHPKSLRVRLLLSVTHAMIWLCMCRTLGEFSDGKILVVWEVLNLVSMDTLQLQEEVLVRLQDL
jgi:hypothetical protein